MATTVSLEFTDAQWALILEHYPKQFDGEGVLPDAVTAELLASYLVEDVKGVVTGVIQDKASLGQKDAFAV
jgi:hypothetical protein|tara:strand:+ start:391 stop:603 length:213 start_codon:yes stop_codon:yes gene_type:complete